MTIEMEDGQIRRHFDMAYSELRSQFINISKPHLTASIINLLKIKYSNVINSARTSDYINSIESLLRILEKRGVLSYDNIEVLKYISENHVRDNVLERALRNYEGQRLTSLPPYNRYLTQSGKYPKKQATKPKATASNQRVIRGVNDTENENEIENESINQILEIPANRASSEDLTIPATETLIQNNVSTSLTERRKFVNYRICFVKVCHNICSRCGKAAVLGAFIGIILLIILTFMSNLLSVKPPAGASHFKAQPGTSGLETIYNNASQVHRQPIQMTLYTTQPAFKITLPGSIDIGSMDQNPAHNESEIMTKVFLEISEKLGKHWRNVARHLGVTEYDIDEIDNQLNLSLNEKAFKALLKFQSKCNSLQWKPKLKHALDKARRRDLMELVDELSSRK